VTALLVVLAIAVAAGGVVAMAAPNPRHAALGASWAALAAAFVGDPLPDPAALTARVAGAALAGWLLWMALRDAPRATDRSALGLSGNAAVAMVALVAGWFAALALASQLAAAGPDGASSTAAAALAAGSPIAAAALGTSFALVVLAAYPVLAPRDGLRMGLGTMLLMVAAELAIAAIGGGDDGTAIAFGVSLACAGAALASIAAVLLRQPAGLALRDPHGHELVAHRATNNLRRTDLP
jgi:multisubunit Na+/H+ antiporter MnhC subunit